MSLNPDEMVTCPYDNAHTMVLSRMQFHLHRCRAQHPNAVKVPCPFNTTHIVNKVEIAWHMEWCTSRITGEREFIKIGGDQMNGAPVVEAMDPIRVENENEVWGEEEVCGDSVLEKVKEVVQTKPAFTNKICSTKSVRKQHRLQERRRFIEVTGSSNDSVKKKEEYENDKRNKKQPISNPWDNLGQKVENLEDKAGAMQANKSQPSPRSNFNEKGATAVNSPRTENQATANAWDTFRSKEMAMKDQDRKENGYRTKGTPWKNLNNMEKSFVEMRVSERSQPSRDPANPWNTQPQSSPNYAEQNDFPVLPVSGRGRRIRN